MRHNIETLAVNTIRTLSIDAINQCKFRSSWTTDGCSTNGLCFMGESFES